MIKIIQTVWFSLLVSVVLLATAGAAPERDDRRFPEDRIEQLVAPIALYPNALLAQVLMAATYPSEVTQAARWARRYQNLSGEELQDALEDESWDPSVKSLVAFPGLLARMGGEPEWVEDLGNAFLGQQDEVMDAIQRMRARARAAGYLESTPNQEVRVRGRVIDIQPTRPDTVYVPNYNPTLVFGDDWHYPTVYYPNLYAKETYPHHKSSGYDTNSDLLTFGIGAVVGAILFSQFDWNNRQIIVDHRSDRHRYPHEVSGPVKWWHDPAHRHGTRYQDPDLEKRYGWNRMSPRREWSDDERDSRRHSRNRDRWSGDLDRDGRSDRQHHEIFVFPSDSENPQQRPRHRDRPSEDADRGDRADRPRRESPTFPFDSEKSQQRPQHRDRPSEDADRVDRTDQPRRESPTFPFDSEKSQQRLQHRDRTSEDVDRGDRTDQPRRESPTFSFDSEKPQQRPQHRDRPSEDVDRGDRADRPHRESSFPFDSEKPQQRPQRQDRPSDVVEGADRDNRAERPRRASPTSPIDAENPQQRAQRWGNPSRDPNVDHQREGNELPRRQPPIVRPLQEAPQPVERPSPAPRMNPDSGGGRPVRELPAPRPTPGTLPSASDDSSRSPLRSEGGKGRSPRGEGVSSPGD
ncbi:putative DUF3300 domain-containing protein [Gammaproteobacteria bacterium]